MEIFERDPMCIGGVYPAVSPDGTAQKANVVRVDFVHGCRMASASLDDMQHAGPLERASYGSEQLPGIDAEAFMAMVVMAGVVIACAGTMISSGHFDVGRTVETMGCFVGGFFFRSMLGK